LREKCRLRVFENRVLRRIFGPKRDEVTGEWRRLHNKELYALNFSPNINRVIESIRLKWKGHVARMGERRGAYRVLVRNLGKRDDLVDAGVDGRKILKSVFEKWDGGVDWIDLAQDRECGNELCGYIKCRKFLE
jgi:hypothetical protein